jgi:hypothetical protein
MSEIASKIGLKMIGPGAEAPGPTRVREEDRACSR